MTATLVLVAVVALWIATAIGGAYLADLGRRRGARRGRQRSRLEGR